LNPDVVDAIERLRERRILSDAQAAPLSRVYRGELVSVEPELRVALYAGVLLLVTGVGLFLKENHERIGPAAIAVILGAAALACLFYAWRRLPPFSWQNVPSPHVGADYVLLLGVLLAAADLAWIESQFRLLGPNWAFHAETAVHALRLIGSGLFDEFPTLQIVLGHLGEGIPAYLWRIDNRNAWMKARHKYAAKKSVADYVRSNFVVTTSGNFSTSALNQAIEEIGIEHLTPVSKFFHGRITLTTLRLVRCVIVAEVAA